MNDIESNSTENIEGYQGRSLYPGDPPNPSRSRILQGTFPFSKHSAGPSQLVRSFPQLEAICKISPRRLSARCERTTEPTKEKPTKPQAFQKASGGRRRPRRVREQTENSSHGERVEVLSHKFIELRWAAVPVEWPARPRKLKSETMAESTIADANGHGIKNGADHLRSVMWPRRSRVESPIGFGVEAGQ